MESRDTSDARHEEHAEDPVDQTAEGAGPEEPGTPAQGETPEGETAEGETGEAEMPQGEPTEGERAEGEDQAEDKARESINKAFE